MSDTLQEESNQMSEHQVNRSGVCEIPGCPCRGWSAQETASAIVLKEGQQAVFRDRQGHLFTRTVTRVGSNTIDLDGLTYEYNERAKDVVLVEIISQHQPAARGGGEEWRVGSRSNSPEGDATIYTVKGNRWIGQVKATVADQIVTEHNQHQSLVAERERLRAALGEMLNRFYPHTCDRGPLCAKCGALRAAQSVFNETDNQQRSTSE